MQWMGLQLVHSSDSRHNDFGGSARSGINSTAQKRHAAHLCPAGDLGGAGDDALRQPRQPRDIHAVAAGARACAKAHAGFSAMPCKPQPLLLHTATATKTPIHHGHTIARGQFGFEGVRICRSEWRTLGELVEEGDGLGLAIEAGRRHSARHVPDRDARVQRVLLRQSVVVRCKQAPTYKNIGFLSATLGFAQLKAWVRRVLIRYLMVVRCTQAPAQP